MCIIKDKLMQKYSFFVCVCAGNGNCLGPLKIRVLEIPKTSLFFSKDEPSLIIYVQLCFQNESWHTNYLWAHKWYGVAFYNCVITMKYECRFAYFRSVTGGALGISNEIRYRYSQLNDIFSSNRTNIPGHHLKQNAYQ